MEKTRAAASSLLISMFLPGTLLLVYASAAQAAIVANSADDICPASADPCVITQQVRVEDGSVLDFGTRGVVVQEPGVLDFGVGDGAVLCGRFAATSTGASVLARGTLPTGGTAGGNVQIDSRRRCSANASLPCLVDTTCSSAGAGTCSVGDGSIVVGGKILANADSPGDLRLRAAGNVQLNKLVSTAGTLGTSDGGDITVESLQGSVTVNDKMELTGGAQATGGDLTIDAAVDAGIDAIIDAGGGDFDGGSVAISAGRTVTIGDDILADSMSGAGFGGRIEVAAGGDIAIVGGTALNRLHLSTEGHQSAENAGGDGGTQSYDAGGSVTVSRYVRFDSNGAAPDGFGDTIAFSAGGDVTIEAIAFSKAKGSAGGGGSFEVQAVGDLTLSSTALLDATGYGGGGGDIYLQAGGNLVLNGDVEAGASTAGLAGSVQAKAGGDASVAGLVATGGGSGIFFGELRLEACRVTIAGSLSNSASSGLNQIVGREHITVLASGRVVASGAGGSNRMRYRTSAKPPIVQGTVTPAAALAVDGSLVGCPVCGNLEIDQGETCDDGGTAGGDGCSATCQDEGCIAQTPGYPSVPLCDDGNECTDDACNSAAHSCAHTTSACSDGIACTIDACAGTTCAHTPVAAACVDTNPCTQDICSTTVGCFHPPQDGACDDGVFCNGADACGSGTCSQHGGDPCASGGECADLCNEALDSCFDAAGAACTDEGNVCTTDACDGAGGCVHVPNSAPCDDGVFCNGGDRCSGGACSMHAGDPCTLNAECRRLCNEGADSCIEPSGTPCADDGTPCTGDACDGAGSCAHPPVDAACDDYDFCTVDEACLEGQCVATALPELRVTGLKAVLRDGLDDDSLALKGVIALSALTVSPSDVDVQLVIGDPSGQVLYDATVPAGRFVNARGAGVVFRYRAESPAEAGGIVKASFKKVQATQTVRIRFKSSSVDMTEVVSQWPVSAAVLLGDAPATSPCTSATGLWCTARSSRLSCKSP